MSEGERNTEREMRGTQKREMQIERERTNIHRNLQPLLSRIVDKSPPTSLVVMHEMEVSGMM